MIREDKRTEDLGIVPRLGPTVKVQDLAQCPNYTSLDATGLYQR